MKQFFCILTIPLVIFSQEVFASSYNQYTQSYSNQGTLNGSMQDTNSRLRNDASEYCQTLPEKMKVLERTVEKENNAFLGSNSSYDERKSEIYKQQKTFPEYKNSEKTRREKPSWWRQEGSYEGWGFD